MVEQFPSSVVEDAWVRSGEKCECTRTTHGHTGRCNKALYRWRRGERGEVGCWEAHSISEFHMPLVSDCEILCCDCHYATF